MRFFLVLFSFFTTSTLLTAQSKESRDYLPDFDATLKNRFEYATDTKSARFEVRNSRMGLYGKVTPFISYRAQVELSNEGKFEVLDLFANLRLFKGFDVSLGQLSVPVFNSHQTTPSQMLFANRSFLAKFNAGTRDIGILATYKLDLNGFPVTFQAGTFNGSTINKPIWTEKLSYSARVLAGRMDGFMATAKFYRYPLSSENDFLMYGADIRYASGRVKIESEIMNRHNYFGGINRLTSYLQGAFSFPLKESGFFKDVTPAVRWDGIGENFAKEGFDVNRLTLGLSFGFTTKPFSSLLRFDYECYFIQNPIQELSVSDEINSNKITMELLLVF